MAKHVMTPARRAALRKAQLVSARKRRRNGLKSAARRNVKQGASYARATYGTKKGRRRIVKGAVIGATLAGVGAGAVAGYRSEPYQVSKGLRKSARKKTFVDKAAKAKYKKRVRPIIQANVWRKKAKRR